MEPWRQSNSNNAQIWEQKCKLSVKAEGVQLIEAGSDIAEVEKYSFEDLIYVQRSGPEHSLSLTWAHRRHKASIKTLTTV